MQRVRPKKHLGQHFLNDSSIATRIVDSLDVNSSSSVLEVGPGMGVLTGMLLKRYDDRFYAAEVDAESVEYLKKHFVNLGDRLMGVDFLRMDLSSVSTTSLAIIGNFPYNISSQILFKVLDNRNLITKVVGMMQREVAQRIAHGPGSKVYGILSVLLQAFYEVEYLFTVSSGVFTPPPKVQSAVVRLTRNSTQSLGCDEALFFRVVKLAFNQRRKTIRNSIKSIINTSAPEGPYLNMRPEQLSVGQFVQLTQWLQENRPGE